MASTCGSDAHGRAHGISKTLRSAEYTARCAHRVPVKVTDGRDAREHVGGAAERGEPVRAAAAREQERMSALQCAAAPVCSTTPQPNAVIWAPRERVHARALQRERLVLAAARAGHLPVHRSVNVCALERQTGTRTSLAASARAPLPAS